MPPVYEYRCPKCQAHTLDMRTIEERHDAPTCPRVGCGTQTELIVSAVRGNVKNPAVPKGSK